MMIKLSDVHLKAKDYTESNLNGLNLGEFGKVIFGV